MKEGIKVVFAGPRAVELRAQARPPVADNEVLIKTERSLLSPGTELALYEGKHAGIADPEIPYAKYPHFPGYASIGLVVQAGGGVSVPKTGSRIFHHGRHASWSVLNPQTEVWLPVPAGLSDDEILLARLVQISATTLYRLHSHPKRVIVIGAGMVGLLAAQVFRANGIRDVVIQDLNAERTARASHCGLRAVIGASGQGLATALEALSGPPDCIVEATGVPELVPVALAAVRRGGDVLLLGSPRGPQEIDLYKLVHLKGASLIGVHETMVPNYAAAGRPSRHELSRQAFHWIRTRQVTVDSLITQVVPPSGLPAIYEHLACDKTTMLGVAVGWTGLVK